MSKIKSFRGKIADNGQDKITLHTNDGSTGYRIKKFEAIPDAPGVGSSNHILKIYKTKQSSITSTFDFSDQVLIGSVWLRDNVDSGYVGAIESIIFDNEVFNQDIFVTHVDTVGTESTNYYIELEQFKLDLNDNTMATLKDIRNETLAL
jgi:hypothetical protein